MAQDHYVAQTYLKHFGDLSKGGMLNAYRKSDGAEFTCWPADVCRETDGDLNPRLQQPDLLGDYRAIFEPSWNLAIEKVLAAEMSARDVFALSGYAATLMVCTPTWRRVGVKLVNNQMRGTLLFQKRMQEKRGTLELENREALESLERGDVRIDTDPDYVKAVATKHLVDYAIATYNADWIIIENETDVPFITSDNPVAYWDRGVNVQPTIRFLPITPQICVEIKFDSRGLDGKRLTPEEVGARLSNPPQGRMQKVKAKGSG